MGINHLWQHALAPCKDKKINPPVPLSHFKGKKLGIDLSVWIHEIGKKTPTCLQLYFDPSRPNSPTQLINDIKARAYILQRSRIIPIFVIDGHPHPVKAATIANRREKIQKARQDMSMFFYLCISSPDKITNDDRNLFEKNIQSFPVRTKEVLHLIVDMFKKNDIQFIQAPYEAEWQLASLPSTRKPIFSCLASL